MMYTLFGQEEKRSAVKKFWAGVLMITMNLSFAGAGTIFLTSEFAYAASPVTIFSDGFETDDFSNWTSVDDDWDVTHGSGHAGNKKAQVSDQGLSDDILRKNVSTGGYSGVTLSYYYRIAQALESGDHVRVQWWDGLLWQPVADYTNVGTGGWVSATHVLPAGAGNLASFKFRFTADDLSSHDEFQLDDVLLTATPTTATLTLVKQVVNDNGGSAEATAWTLAASGQTPLSGTTGSADVTGKMVTAGAYDLSETGGPSGYAASDWVCTGTGTQTDGDTVTLAGGQSATCTITNDDIAPKLTVTKIVVNNDGGEAIVEDFSLFVGETSVTSGEQDAYDAGTYIVSETPMAGYAGTINGDCADDGTVTLQVGDVKECTITNDDVAPGLTLMKVVTNDNGGTATADDFQAQIDEEDVPWGQTQTLEAGTYAISETGLGGYEAGEWDCDGGSLDGDEITLGLDETVVCTITNDDIAPQLTVIKHMVNDNGGTAVAGDFTMLVTGTDVPDVSFDGDEEGTAVTLNAGQYSVDEGDADGYEKTLSEDCAGTIAVGETKTCTVTNDDIAPKLTVTKIVDGGTKVVSDFPLFVGEASVTSGAQGAYSAGTYTVSETSQTGYTGTISGDCSADGDITLNPGDVKACTITNVYTTSAPVCQIEGYKYDADEHPVAGIVIGATTATSTDGEGGIVKGNILVTKTDENGYYCLNGISSGNVRVFEWPSAGTENDRITVDEHGVEPGINSFFDVFTEIAIHMDTPNQPAEVNSFFDVFTEVDGGTKHQIESFFDIFTELSIAQEDKPIDSFFDVFTEVSLDKEQNTHHTVNFYNKPIVVVTDVCPNIEGTQETVPSGKQLTEGQCVDIPGVPVVPPPVVNGGAVGLSFLGGGNPGVPGLVLGASTTTGEDLPASCTPYLGDYLRIGKKNNPEQVVLLQTFLNTNLGLNLPVTGYFGPMTHNAVKQFQLENADQVLDPWVPFGLAKKTPTGYVYKTTKRWINLLQCKSLDIPMPQLP